MLSKSILVLLKSILMLLKIYYDIVKKHCIVAEQHFNVVKQTLSSSKSLNCQLYLNLAQVITVSLYLVVSCWKLSCCNNNERKNLITNFPNIFTFFISFNLSVQILVDHFAPMDKFSSIISKKVLLVSSRAGNKMSCGCKHCFYLLLFFNQLI